MRTKPSRVVIGFSIGLLLIGAIVVETYRSTVAYQQTVNSVTQSNEIERNLSSLLTALDDAESGQRGYIITGNSTYLQPYNDAVAAIKTASLALRGLTSGDANLSFEYRLLLPIINEKLVDLNGTILVRQTRGFAAAQAIVNNNFGQLFMNEIRGIVTKMNRYIGTLQSEEISLANQQGAERTGFSFLGSIFAIGLIIFATYSIDRKAATEERARRQAELLQDILTHDLRNYNQISMTSAELLGERLGRNKELKDQTASLVRGIEGSTQLIERARELGRIISEERPKLYPVDLVSSMERAATVVKKAYPEKEIKETMKVVTREGSPPAEKIRVLADDLLDEVFLNLFSNSAKFTQGKFVPIGITVEERSLNRGVRWMVHDLLGKSTRELGPGGNGYWRISVADRGSGISDGRKQSIFDRYSSAKKETGLGLSIVYALVVRRYGGRITVRDNDDAPASLASAGDGGGTVFEISLRRA